MNQYQVVVFKIPEQQEKTTILDDKIDSKPELPLLGIIGPE